MSQVRLTGAGGGNTILNGNDTITADQTFEFPNAGGTLVTGNKDSTGTGGSSGSAQVVGYQQGAWVPTMDEGTLTDSSQNRWWRIGNAVTVVGYLADWTDHETDQAITIQGLPYPSTENAVGGPVFATRCGAQVTTTYVNHTGAVSGLLFYFSSDSTAGNWTSVRYNNTNNATQIRFMASYITDNTDWAPGNSATVS